MTVTLWNRIEPAIQHADPLADLDGALAARLADPLWLLARQHQLGELRGEDAGTPIQVQVELASAALTEVTIGARAIALSAGQLLEPLVEAEPARIDVRARVSGGRLLLELLAEHDLARLRGAAIAAWPWPTSPESDPGAAALVELARGQWPDGAGVATAIAAGALTTRLGAADVGATIDAIGAAWARWWHGLVGGATDAWSDERLVCRAEVAAGAARLTISDYRGGRLDWDACTLVTPPSPTDLAITEHTTTPTHLAFAGAPSTRFWELEDRRYDVARVEVGLGDVGSALVIETALTYAADWFVVPVPVATGALHRVFRLTVIDTFGLHTVVPHVEEVRPDPDWTAWRLSGSTTPGMLLVPAMASPLSGEAVEEVAIVTDELANLAWAIERIVPTGLARGVPVARAEAPPAPVTTADWWYRALPQLPGDRIPLAPISATHVRRATGVDPDHPVPPVGGELIAPDWTVRKDAIGRLGVIVTRRWQNALDRDGARIVWRTREVRPGAGVPGFHLAADALLTGDPRTPR